MMKKTVISIIIFILIFTAPLDASAAEISTTVWECTFDNVSDWTIKDGFEYPTGFSCYLFPNLSKAIGGGKNATDGFRLCSEESNGPYANCAYIPVKSGKTYRFSADIYTEAVGNYGYFFYIQYREKLTSDNVTPTIGKYGTVGTNGLYDDDIGIGEWKTFSCTWTAPDDANFIRFGPKAAGGTIIIVDNMKLELIENEESTPDTENDTLPIETEPQKTQPHTLPVTEPMDDSENKSTDILIYIIPTALILCAIILIFALRRKTHKH